jgi:hypothetical protein
VRDGIFLLDRGLRIQPSYSRALEEIFRRDMLAGFPVMDESVELARHFNEKFKQEIKISHIELFTVYSVDNYYPQNMPRAMVVAKISF